MTERPGRISETGKTRRRELIDLPNLFQNLCDAGRTGTLILTSRDGRVLYFYLREGTLAAAFDGDPEFLGKALVKTRALEWAELKEFTEFFRPTPATFDTLLLDQERVTADAIKAAREFVIRELVCEALTWRRPRTEFQDGSPIPALVRVNLPHPDVSVPTKPLIMHGVYQLDEWRRVRELLPSDQDVLAQAEGASADGANQEVLDLVDGRRTAGDIVAQTRMGRSEAWEILRGLVGAGTVRLLTRMELVDLAKDLEEDEGGGAAGDKSIALYERAEELGLEDPQVWLWLATAYEARGETEEASRRYLQVARSRKRREQGRGTSTRAFRRALELRPDDGALKRELIQKLLDEERDEEAALALEQYVAWLRERGDPIAAYRAARPLLQELEEFEEILVLQAELSAESGNTAEASGLYRRVAEIRLDSELREEFELEEQVEILRRILELEPADLDARWRLVQLLSTSNDPRAVEELEAFVGCSGDDPRLMDAFQELERLQPDRSRVGPRANALLARGDLEEARTLLEAALAQEGRLPEELLDAFVSLDRRQASPASDELLARARIKAGRIHQGVEQLRTRGAKQAQAGEHQDAVRLYRLALEHDPFDRGCRSGLVEVLQDQGPRDEWLADLRALADVARLSGRLDEAVDCLRSYAHEVGDPAARLELVRLQLLRGGDEALSELKAFALTCVEEQDLGLLRWALDRARALSASEDWFEGLPSD